MLSAFEYPNDVLYNINFSNLTLVDFGRAVDLVQNSDNPKEDNSHNTMFYGNAATMEMQCVAMRNGQSWSYDADTYGILCCAHVLLYGTHLQIKKGKNNRWKLSSSLKRYWKQDIWMEIFDSLLNLDEVSGSAIGSRASSLRTLRRKIDAYLESDSKYLHELLARQANLLPDNRNKIS